MGLGGEGERIKKDKKTLIDTDHSMVITRRQEGRGEVGEGTGE